MHTPTHSISVTPQRHRWFAILTVFALLFSGGVVAQVAMAPSAQAAVNNLFPADVDGFPKGNFFADEALFLTATSDIEGGRICIVEESVTDPSSTNCLSPAWGSPNTYVTLGTLLGVPLEAPLLAPGRWRLLSTVVVDDKEIGHELSEVFEVRPCQGDCDTSVGQAQVDAWKDGAESNARAYSAASHAADAWTAVDAAATAGRSMYYAAGGGLLGLTLGFGYGLFNYEVDLSTEAKARTIFKDLTAAVGAMYAGIAADPPDFDYDTVAQPALLETLDVDDPLFEEYFEVLTGLEAYGKASRIAYERFQGAQIDGDDDAASTQAQAAADFTFAMVREMYALQEIQPRVSAIDWMTEPITTPEKLADAVAERARITADGHTPEQVQALEDAGLSAEQIAELEDSYSDDISGIDPDRSFADHLDEIALLLPQAIEDYDQFGRALAVIATEYAGDPPASNRSPVSDFSATPLSGTAPLTVTLASEASDPDGDALTLRWDIAGIRFVDDETSVTHTFTEPGTYGVSLVADDGELWDQAVKWIEVLPAGWVGGDNRAPIAVFTPSLVDEEGPITQTFTSNSVDPDGDPLTHTWYFGDGTTATGETVTKTFPAGYIMSVLLVVSDGQLTAQASGEVRSRCAGCGSDTNAPPEPSFTATPVEGTAPLDVTFDATSTDADGDALTHTWYFGDGETATGDAVSHRYAYAGVYTATLVASDGASSRAVTRTITVTNPPRAFSAEFTTSQVLDAADLVNGSHLVQAPGAWSENPRYAPANIIAPTTALWNSPNGEATEHTFLIEVAGKGKALLDRIVLTNSPGGDATPREFTVELSQDAAPTGTYRTVIDHGVMEQSREPQTFAFTSQTATFLRLTLHNNHGANYMTLSDLSLPTAERVGGTVSRTAGIPARITTVSSQHSSYPATNILDSGNTMWQALSNTNESVRISLAGSEPRTVDSVTLRSTGGTNSLRGFELRTSLDGSTWTTVLTDEMARSAEEQEFSFTETQARFVELRVESSHGAAVAALRQLVMTDPEGTPLTNPTGGGARIADVSGTLAGWDPTTALESSGRMWYAPRGEITNQYLTVLLREGATETIDRVMVQTGADRPKNVEVWVSDSGLEDTDFTRVASQTLHDVSDEQWIWFEPTQARAVHLRILDGYGTNYVGVNELRVVAASRGGATVPFVDLSQPGDHDIVSWGWDFGDGTTSTQQHPVHTFPGAGTYTITLRVTDADGATQTTTGSYTVPEVPTLTLTATPGTTVNENSATTITAASDGVEIVDWQWNPGFGPGSNARGSSLGVYFPDEGEYDVTAQGTTADGLPAGPVTLRFTVLNLPPFANAGAPQRGYALDPITPVAAASDRVDAITCHWDWGDGTAHDFVSDCDGWNVRVPHVYALPGTYTATLTVDDGTETRTSTVELTADFRPSMLQITRAVPEGDGLRAELRLVDGRNGEPLVGQSVSVAAAGQTGTGSTDAEGRASILVPDASAAETLRVSFGGSATHEPTELERAVKVPRADIVFMVDESGSMAGIQSRVKERIGEIAQGLGVGLDYRLGLTGYADDSREQSRSRVLSPITENMDEFLPAVHGLRVTGGAASAFHAVVRASEDLEYRPGAAVCFVLVSDESYFAPNDRFPETFDDALSALQGHRAPLYTIISTHAPSQAMWGNGDGLAGQSGGQSWSTTAFINDASAVLDALVETCVTQATVPELQLTKTSAEDVVEPGASVEYTLTVENLGAVEVTGIALTDALPSGATFAGASEGGTESAGVVTWPEFSLEPTQTATRTVTVTMPSFSTSGDHTVRNTAVVEDDGANGAEADMANNTATRDVVVRVPRSHDVGIVGTHDAPDGVTSGDEFSVTFAVADYGNEAAEDLEVLIRVPDRFEPVAVEAEGWAGGLPAAAHPDGVTEGQWLALRADGLSSDVSQTITVDFRTRALEQLPVRLDELSIDAGSSPAWPPLPDSAVIPACISAAQDDIAANNCTNPEVPLRDLQVEVISRLSDGISHLVVIARATAALEDRAILLRWTPEGSSVSPEFVEQILLAGESQLIAWPGSAFDGDRAAIDWPGWRSLTASDRDEAGRLLHPETGEVMTEEERMALVRGERILDPGETDSAWRLPSQLVVSVDDVSAAFTVPYREIVPGVPGGVAVVDPEPVDPEPVDPEPVDPEPVDPVDPEPVDPDAGDPESLPPTDSLPTTGAVANEFVVILALLLLGAGFTLFRTSRKARPLESAR